MKLLRNSEVLKGILFLAAVSAAAVIYCFYTNIGSVIFISALCLAFIVIHTFITWKRYRRISSLASDIDSILHGNDHIMRSSYDEGELAVLECEIYKMIVCLREQTLDIKASGNVLGDIAWNCEAIGNIVKNCTEHTPAGGTISITAEENPLFSEICICDNGSGIAEDDLPHIFERFYKGGNSDESSFGIGLNLARMIITNQNGTVKAENRQSGGAKFIIRFYKEII